MRHHTPNHNDGHQQKAWTVALRSRWLTLSAGLGGDRHPTINVRKFDLSDKTRDHNKKENRLIWCVTVRSRAPEGRLPWRDQRRTRQRRSTVDRPADHVRAAGQDARPECGAGSGVSCGSWQRPESSCWWIRVIKEPKSRSSRQGQEQARFAEAGLFGRMPACAVLTNERTPSSRAGAACASSGAAPVKLATCASHRRSIELREHQWMKRVPSRTIR